MNSERKHTGPDKKSENLKTAGQEKGKRNYEDPSGTDPERYENSGDKSREKLPDPKNHTTPDERMIDPDRGQ